MGEVSGELLPAVNGISAQTMSMGRVLELLATGGPVVAILLILSIAALAIVLVKLWQFRALQLGDGRPARDALKLYRAGHVEEALALATRTRNPVAQVLARAIRGKGRRHLTERQVREEVERHGNDLLEALRGYLRPLEVIANLAPLLGLFGTVLGMIAAFRQMEEAGSQVSPALLSGGIWEALLTTAVGLAVAIPVVALVNWLERVVDRLAQEMDSTVTQVFTEDLSPPIRGEQTDATGFFDTVSVAAGE
jgi:biopolymer transport protein ExbB